jgi:predicted DsbA family dithiol-disulfide isomerase
LAELQQKHDVDIEWLPYELRPEPVPLPDLSGPDGERFRLNWERGVAPLAAQFGVEMRYPPTKPRSRLAHEAAEAAREQGRSDAMRRAIFEAYFVENRDIGLPEVLVEVAREAGLDAGSLRAALDGGQYTQRVTDLEQVSRRLGVSAVPTIVIGDVGVAGVQPYSVLLQVLREAERRAAGAGAERQG